METVEGDKQSATLTSSSPTSIIFTSKAEAFSAKASITTDPDLTAELATEDTAILGGTQRRDIVSFSLAPVQVTSPSQLSSQSYFAVYTLLGVGITVTLHSTGTLMPALLI